MSGRHRGGRRGGDVVVYLLVALAALTVLAAIVGVAGSLS